MKTAMDYVKERDERVDVAGKTARLKEWCEKFFDDKSWDIRDEGNTQRLQPFHGNSAVWVEVVLTQSKACCKIVWDDEGDAASTNISAFWSDTNIEDFRYRIEAAWESAVQRSDTILQIYYPSRIPVNSAE